MDYHKNVISITEEQAYDNFKYDYFENNKSLKEAFEVNFQDLDVDLIKEQIDLIDAHIELCKKYIDEYKKKINSLDKLKNDIKEIIYPIVEMNNGIILGNKHKVCFTKTKRVDLLDEDQIPTEYKTEEINIKIDKMKLKNDIKQGKEIPGATLNEYTHLRFVVKSIKDMK